MPISGAEYWMTLKWTHCAAPPPRRRGRMLGAARRVLRAASVGGGGRLLAVFAAVLCLEVFPTADAAASHVCWAAEGRCCSGLRNGTWDAADDSCSEDDVAFLKLSLLHRHTAHLQQPVDVNEEARYRLHDCAKIGCYSRYEPRNSCQCSSSCKKYGNCCKDFDSVCKPSASCAPADCGHYVRSKPCQCNAQCDAYQNCCSNYVTLCPQPTTTTPTTTAEPNMPTKTFYMYRAQNDEDYPPLNTNMANLGGVLWYLHNEVVNRCDSGRGRGEWGYRRFKITRIIRYRVTYRPTSELYNEGGNVFGVRVAFDSGACTGAFRGMRDCKGVWKRYGYIVGCNVLGEGPYPTCPDKSAENYCPINYRDAAWFSFPGPCPDNKFDQCSDAQAKKDPGGFSRQVTGDKDATWTYEEAGEINIDDLVGISARYKSHRDFCNAGCLEYIKYGHKKDTGKCTDWWNGKMDEVKNLERIKKTDEAFKKAYPEMPGDDDMNIKCDFDREKFYRGLR
eukprot:TRINITY_DN23283_c0_g1_i1.p1 TRINITY_DN23283_c0_g1~~TRINITY_DN23283_c0_g1_i1.p1  ORF type:complete len:532 (+),score=92.06 TRINITY_DN23283_c0_g1_i1:83-1597(+)